MKIITENPNCIEFKDAPRGSIFLEKGVVYFKLLQEVVMAGSVFSAVTTTVIKLEDLGRYNAVDMATGQLKNISATALVTPVPNAKLVLC